MKTKIEAFLRLNAELKEHCYNLAIKWHGYGKNLGLSDWETGCYDYSKKGIDKIDFSYDKYDSEFRIGYEFTDRCGDTDSFYTYFKLEEIIDEDIIKRKIDKKAEIKKAKLEKEKLEKEKQEKEKIERERRLYEELKQKFEN